MVVVDGSELLCLDPIISTFKKSSGEHGGLFTSTAGASSSIPVGNTFDVTVRC